MGKPYSDDLRERVVAAIEAGHTRVKVAELYNMALSTVGGFIRRKRETGSVIPLPDHFEHAATPSPLFNYRSPGLDSIQTDLGSVSVQTSSAGTRLSRSSPIRL